MNNLVTSSLGLVLLALAVSPLGDTVRSPLLMTSQLGHLEFGPPDARKATQERLGCEAGKPELKQVSQSGFVLGMDGTLNADLTCTGAPNGCDIDE